MMPCLDSRVVKWAAGVLTFAALSLPGLVHAAEHPTAHERAAIAAAGARRFWLYADEFARNPELRATPDQVVVIPLEPAPRSRRFVRTEVPYTFDSAAKYRFCLRPDDPSLRDLDVIAERDGRSLAHLRPGDACRTLTVSPGRYRLELWHDGAALEDGGRVAFARFAQPVTLGAESVSGLFTTACTPTSNNPMATVIAPDGAFLKAIGGQHIVEAPSTDVFWGLTFCTDGHGNVTMQNDEYYGLQYVHAADPSGTDARLYLSQASSPTLFAATDLGNNQFTLAANFAGTLYPIVVGSDGALRWTTPGSAPAILTVQQVYYPSGQAVPLQAGQVAFGTKGCGTSDVGTFVFTQSIPNLGVYTFLVSPLAGAIKSAQPGPETQAVLFSGAGDTGQVEILAAPTSCLSTRPTSFEVVGYRDFLVATDTCQSCNLTGLDLSGLMLAGGRFQGSTFTGANLTGTNMQSASLDNANFNSAGTVLANTNMLGAVIRCTNFSGADLSSAMFQLSGIIAPIVTSDFTCWLNLTGAKLAVSTFPLTQWRYFNLSGATVAGLAGATLSTMNNRLNLSGGILTNMNLSGVILDGASLSCAGAGNTICTDLTGTSLSSASLKQANLANALLQSANLSYANLDGANLLSANLSASNGGPSATLQGAFLRNANLSYATLTGANLAYSDFYSTSGRGGTCSWPVDGTGTPACATAAYATLANTSLVGAYLTGTDFGGAKPQSADFTYSWLAGANFTSATLTADPNTGRRTAFSGAHLEGANFTYAQVDGADFTSAILNLSSSGTLWSQLDPAKNIAFPGYTAFTGTTLGCVTFAYSASTVVPITDSTNFCPDGGTGPCSPSQWQTPKLPPPPLPASCGAKGQNDLNWTTTSYAK